MIETITIITLTLLFLSFVRPGKTPPLDNPLVIERPGQYHMTLAPQLNLAQPLIEDIARLFDATGSADCASQLFEIRDPEIAAHGHPTYHLAVTCCRGMLYFQAASVPGKLLAPYDDITQFASATLSRHGIAGLPLHAPTAQAIQQAVQAAAPLRHADIKSLPSGSER